MESRRSSKKTRSYGGAPRGSRNSQNSLGTNSGSCPQYKEHVKSAPLGLPQLEQQQQNRRPHQKSTGRFRRESQTSDSGSGSLASPSSPSAKQHVLPIQRLRDAGQAGSSGEVQEVALAVLGAPAVGKSTFVHCALDLKKASTSPISSKKVSLEGKISTVRLLELEIEDVEVTADQKVHWPKRVGDQNMPEIDGVLALYDVMDRSSIGPMPNLLKALSKEALPTVLVSTKCDKPLKSWEVDQDTVEKFCSTLQGLETFQTSATAPETHKRCISVMLRNIMLERRGKDEENSPKADHDVRPRAPTNSQPIEAPQSMYPGRERSKHARAASEVPSSISRNVGRTVQTSQPSDNSVAETSQTENSRDRKPPRRASDGVTGSLPSPAFRQSPDITDVKSVSMSHDQETQGSEKSKTGMNVPMRPHPSSSSGLSATVADPFSKNREKDGATDADYVDPTEINSAGNDDTNAIDSGASFEDLVDRLLSQSMKKSDAKFATIFLCLYRKFAAPSTLIMAIIGRFEELNDRDLPYLTRMSSQLRCLNILKDWVSDYPGDFAHPLSRRIMTGFMQSLATSQEHSIASKEISPHLEVISEDDDTEWACSDKTRSRANTMESFLTTSSAQSAASTLNADSPTFTADSSTEDIVGHIGPEKAPMSQPSRVSATLSSTSSISRSNSQSTGSFQTLLNTVENAQRQAQLLTPISRNMLTKVQWHQLMEIPEEQVARELTRIDWIMYSSIRPRDLIRHVSLQADQKEKCRSLEHVNRMIHQFNHVAFWVTNMILLRDKPKHRAKALEKFMAIAWKLRYLNNYNSLGAVIAGINGTAVHRLAQTRELIPAEAQKQFMRLEILMGTQRSHFAYRLAFGNTSSSRIPFLPLHRRDLVLAEQGNRTYVSGSEHERINWKKFEIMGEVIVGIRKSQEVSYPTIKRNEEVQRLVLDGRFCKDDDVLYERSIQIEAPGIGENTKKRFNWFQR